MLNQESSLLYNQPPAPPLVTPQICIGEPLTASVFHLKAIKQTQTSLVTKTPYSYIHKTKPPVPPKDFTHLQTQY